MVKPKTKPFADDFDPEDLHFGDADHTSASLSKKNKKQSEGGREHYGGLAGKKKSQVERDDDLGVGKYAGVKSSRAALDMAADSESDSDSEMQVEDDSDEYLSSSEIEASEPHTKNNSLVNQLKLLEDEEEQQLKIISSRAVDEVERGKHVKNQYILWDKILDLRVHMQPLLCAVNRLPSVSEVRAFEEDEKLNKNKSLAVGELYGVIEGLLGLQETLMSQDKIPLKKRKVSSSDEEEASPMNLAWKRSCALERTLLPFCKDALDKWHQKVVLANESSTKKQLRIINQGVWQQVELAMRDRERLISRTQILRQPAKRIACEEDDDVEDADGNKNVFPDIFDDTDFYQHLVREWVESNPTRQSDPSLGGIAVKSVQRGKAANTKVDTRASKGRKIRYDVHEKMVNYMVPMHMGPVPWSEEKVSELFASLLAN